MDQRTEAYEAQAKRQSKADDKAKQTTKDRAQAEAKQRKADE
jgi:hypothetical protein